MTPHSSRPAIFLAWLVHLFTACGAVLALLALAAIAERDWTVALAWQFAALAVDGVDGSLARLAKVKQRVPRIDGATLDLVVDYLNYVFIPTAFLWQAELLPPGWAAPLAAAILLSALYVFARSDMKTEDDYFRGFPALWNVVVLYLFAAQLSPTANAGIVGLLVLMSFAPVHFVHPFRVRDYGIWLPLLAILWAAASAPLLWPGWEPPMRSALLWASAASAAALIALGLWRSVRGPRPGRTLPPAEAAIEAGL